MKQKMMFTKMSPVSKKANSLTLDVDPRDIARWQNGELIQVALPYLSASEREFLMTGILDDEWNKLFPKEIAGTIDQGVQLSEEDAMMQVLTEFTQLMVVHEDLINNMVVLHKTGGLTWENVQKIEDAKGKLDELMSSLAGVISNYTFKPL